MRLSCLWAVAAFFYGVGGIYRTVQVPSLLYALVPASVVILAGGMFVQKRSLLWF